jgi:hypothetical protein
MDRAAGCGSTTATRASRRTRSNGWFKFLDGARSAGDLYGRAIVVLAAEQYACRLVLPSTQQVTPHRWPSHNDHARKALAKLAAPPLPATLKQLEKAIEKAHGAYERAQQDARPKPAPVVESDGQTDTENPDDCDDELDELDGCAVDDAVDGDVIDPGGRSAPTGRCTQTPTRGCRAQPARERGGPGSNPRVLPRRIQFAGELDAAPERLPVSEAFPWGVGRREGP